MTALIQHMQLCERVPIGPMMDLSCLHLLQEQKLETMVLRQAQKDVVRAMQGTTQAMLGDLRT
jgi:hypothetical protein